MSDVLRALKDRFDIVRAVRAVKRRRERERLVSQIPRDSIVVASAGMGRSGSTWQFNIVQHALIALGHDDIGSGWIDDLPSFANHKVVLVKSHGYEEVLAERADLVFTAYRDLRDVLASSWRCFKRQPTVEHAHHAVHHFERWAAVADHVMRYEDLLSRGKVAVASDIVRVLLAIDAGVTPDEVRDFRGIDPAQVAAQVEALTSDLNRGEVKQTRAMSNQLYANHVTDGRHGQWSSVPPEVIAGVETQLRKWMQAKGYLPRGIRLDRRVGAGRIDIKLAA